jgi:hypothetical protein
MTSDRVCPTCKKLVVPASGVYRLGGTDFHAPCYERRRFTRADRHRRDERAPRREEREPR